MWQPSIIGQRRVVTEATEEKFKKVAGGRHRSITQQFITTSSLEMKHYSCRSGASYLATSKLIEK
jgi:hypothetical protein